MRYYVFPFIYFYKFLSNWKRVILKLHLIERDSFNVTHFGLMQRCSSDWYYCDIIPLDTEWHDKLNAVSVVSRGQLQKQEVGRVCDDQRFGPAPFITQINKQKTHMKQEIWKPSKQWQNSAVELEIWENLWSSWGDASQTMDWKHKQMAFTAHFLLSGVMDEIQLQVIQASMRYKYTSLEK